MKKSYVSCAMCIPNIVYLEDCYEIEMTFIIFITIFKVLLNTPVTRKTNKEAQNTSTKYV